MERLTEHVVTMPITNPKTGGASRTFTFVGRIDSAEKRNEKWTLVDWKTASDPSRFIAQKTVSYQADLYALAMELCGYPVFDAEYRIISTPTIRYCSKDADASEYEQRCLDWLSSGDNKTVTYNQILDDSRREQARWWLWDISKRILECRHKDVWLTNEHACYNWNRDCPYLDLCMGLSCGRNMEDTIDNDFEPRTRRYADEEVDDKDALTYSTASVMALCEQKYYWMFEHEGGIQRKNDMGGEALQIGRLVHVALEALAKDGLDSAREMVRKYQREAPALGEDAFRKLDEQAAKAMAIVRVAAARWL